QSIDQINDNANVTFNGQYLVDGSKNKQVTQTTTAMTNQALSTDTAATTGLTDLKARNGDSLNIHSTDTVTISYVKDGKTYTSSTTVGSTNKLVDIITSLTSGAITIQSIGTHIGMDASNNTVATASNASAITIGSVAGGIEGQIAGFTMYITDNKGNVNKSANAALDAFEESIRAENASKDNSIVMQIGTKAGQSINVGLSDMKAIALGLQGKDGSTLSIGNQENANAAINVLDSAIQKALDQQTTIGAIESRLEYTQSNLTTASENVTAAESTIRDADMAKEMTEYTKNNVLMQAAQSMLAQANQSSSNALSLLQ
ncbi:flagellin, partial [Anaerovibrio slackiae]|uniref:flagellin n=1 Tax=Anaerovibrio slackiae TaxID=2652309 RepID=UPI00386AE4FA